MNKTLVLVFSIVSGMLFSGCDNYVSCDSTSAIHLAEEIINKDIAGNGNMKIDDNMIMVLKEDSNGNYLCKAQIEGKYNENYKPGPLYLEHYGIEYDRNTNNLNGWITFTISNTTKGNNFYLEIIKN